MPGHALLGSAVHRHQHDRDDRAGRHHRAQFHPAGGFHRPAGGGGYVFAEATIHAAAVRAKPIGLTGLAAMIGALFILDDPIFNGLAISLSSACWCPPLLTLVVIPVLYYAATYKRHAAAQGEAS